MNKTTVTFIRVNDRLGKNPLYSEANVSGVYPPLGIAYLAAAVRQAGFPTTIIDGHAENISQGKLIHRIVQSGAEFVGLFATTFNWPIVAQIARLLKERSPNLQIWVGGPQLTLFPTLCMEENTIDGAVIGEGEAVLPKILNQIKSGAISTDLPGVIFREGDKIFRGKESVIIENLDSLPLPALELLPLLRYQALTLPMPFISMITSRGCPYKCRYCSQVYVGGRYRQHSANRVVEEMIRAKELFKVREIVFFDESFTADKKRVIEICDLIEQKNLKVGWNIRTRADRLDQELMPKLKKAGCYGIHIGVESGSPGIQKAMNKNLNLEKVAKVVKDAKKYDLVTRGYFMLGYPGETLDQIKQTINFARDIDLDWASFSITTPNPGTDIFHDGVTEGRFEKDYWEKYTKGEATKFIGFFTNSQYNEKDLKSLLRKAYMKFYLRPSILLSKLTKKRLWKTLPQTFTIMASILLSKLRIKLTGLGE